MSWLQISLLLFILLYGISYAVIGKFRRRKDEIDSGRKHSSKSGVEILPKVIYLNCHYTAMYVVGKSWLLLLMRLGAAYWMLKTLDFIELSEVFQFEKVC